MIRIDFLGGAVNYTVVYPVLYVGSCIGSIKQTLVVRFVLSEKERDVPFAVKKSVTEVHMRGSYGADAWLDLHRSQTWFGRAGIPRPRVPEPERWKQMKRGRLWAS